MNGQYILIGQTPVEETDLLEWARAFEGNGTRQVAFTKLPWCEVSTVFLGLDHNIFRGGPPILFESMAFWPGRDPHEQQRCSTWLEAEAMHAAMVAEVSRPSAIIAWLWRSTGQTFKTMRRDWRRKWEDFRGIPPSEFDLLMDRLQDKD